MTDDEMSNIYACIYLFDPFPRFKLCANVWPLQNRSEAVNRVGGALMVTHDEVYIRSYSIAPVCSMIQLECYRVLVLEYIK